MHQKIESGVAVESPLYHANKSKVHEFYPVCVVEHDVVRLGGVGNGGGGGHTKSKLVQINTHAATLIDIPIRTWGFEGSHLLITSFQFSAWY